LAGGGRLLEERQATEMNLKPQLNHRQYLAALRRLTPEERLRKAFELTEMTRRLFRTGLRKRFPEMSEDELRRLYLRRLAKCHNRVF
jgi:hypothetical protein